MTVIGRVSAAILSVGMTVVFAEDAFAQNVALVKERQELMGQMGKAFGSVKPILKGENPNVIDAVTSAETWHTNAKKILASFPVGTDRDSVEGSRAKPEIWTKRAEFDAAANTLVAESAKLIEAAKSNDINAFRAQFKPFVQACGGCHKGPRKEGGKFRFPKE